MAANGNTLPIPSFILLFMMNRILHRHSHIGQISDLVAELECETAKDILEQLLKDGIKKYMECRFNAKQPEIIELIFDQIILTKFKKEYHNTISYDFNNNSKSKFYQRLVFNTKDLMCTIFKYVDCGNKLIYHRGTLKGDLFKCSLVCSHWLYHTWNPNVVHYFVMNDIATETIKPNNSQHSIITAWQRIVGVQSVVCTLPHHKYSNIFDYWDKDYDMEFFLGDEDATHDVADIRLLLPKLLMLKKIKSIELLIDADYVEIFHTAMTQWCTTIETFSICIVSAKNGHNQQFLPLELLNAKNILIESLLFLDITWSYKCKHLSIDPRHVIDCKWIKFVIDNCDCSGIKYLSIDDGSFAFDELRQYNKTEYTSLMQQFARKFTNLHTVTINSKLSVDSYFVLLWQYLTSIVKQNHGTVRLCINDSRIDMILPNRSGKLKTADIIADPTPAITRLDVAIYRATSFIESKESLIFKPSLEYLFIDSIFESDKKSNLFPLLTKFFGQSIERYQKHKHQHTTNAPFSSLKVMELRDSNLLIDIKPLSDFLGLIVQMGIMGSQMFVDIFCRFFAYVCAKDDFSSTLDALFSKIGILLVTNKTPINIRIEFYGLIPGKPLHGTLMSKFQSFLDENISCQHNQHEYYKRLKSPEMFVDLLKRKDTTYTINIRNAQLYDIS